MEVEQAATLALVQGLTEFLPVSSSAHLILVPRLFGWADQGLAFDVAVHVGTLGAVVAYFRREIAALWRDWVRSLARGGPTGDSTLAWGVLIGTVPVGLAGLLLEDRIERYLRSPLVIAVATLAFGIVLLLADRLGARRRSERSLGWRDALLIGIAQALALVPGTSRSGITITAALALGFTATGAARFSFLLSIPVILLAGLVKGVDLVRIGGEVDWSAIGYGTAISAASAYACIHAFLRLLERIGLTPFIAYRLLLGGVLLVVFW